MMKHRHQRKRKLAQRAQQQQRKRELEQQAQQQQRKRELEQQAQKQRDDELIMSAVAVFMGTSPDDLPSSSGHLDVDEFDRVIDLESDEKDYVGDYVIDLEGDSDDYHPSKEPRGDDVSCPSTINVNQDRTIGNRSPKERATSAKNDKVPSMAPVRHQEPDSWGAERVPLEPTPPVAPKPTIRKVYVPPVTAPRVQPEKKSETRENRPKRRRRDRGFER